MLDRKYEKIAFLVMKQVRFILAGNKGFGQNLPVNAVGRHCRKKPWAAGVLGTCVREPFVSPAAIGILGIINDKT